MKYLVLILVLSGCAQDKMAHFIMGAGVSIAAKGLGATPLQSCGAAIGLGLVKEYHDSRYGGTVEAMDAFATGAGCVFTLKF